MAKAKHLEPLTEWLEENSREFSLRETLYSCASLIGRQHGHPIMKQVHGRAVMGSHFFGFDVSRLSQLVAEELTPRLLAELRPLVEPTRQTSLIGQGIRVLSVADVVSSTKKSEKLLRRLEASNEFPRRRQISARRVGYLAHEVEGLAAEAVQVQDRRKLRQDELVSKLGLHKKTVARMIEMGELPPPENGTWFERDIDEWILTRPQI